MITVACPSCGASVAFRHAQSCAAVCGACRGVVTRDGGVVRSAGTVSAFLRELSPLQLGVRGVWGQRRFQIIGVIRRGRPGVRWNEWHLALEGGERAWLGEGNGSFAIYQPLPLEAPPFAACVVERPRMLGGEAYLVMEKAEAEVLAADGELPTGVCQGDVGNYVDLRAPGGRRAATLDYRDDPPTVWVGPVVQLAELKLEGCRPITGWSDPDVKVAAAGHDDGAARTVTCPGCAAPLVLASGAVRGVACRFCGTAFDVDDIGDALDLPVSSPASGNPEAYERSLALPLGARGQLNGVTWQIIGAQDRFVRSAGQDWPWTEYFLYNPWRGYRWLVQDGTRHHWNWIERLEDLPVVRDQTAQHDGHSYRLFQRGTAETARVVGEFTWQVRAGERAQTADFVDPPWMLSTERLPEEATASLGTYLPAAAVRAAFPDARRVRAPTGVFLNQPNPWAQRATHGVLAALMVVSILWGAGLFAWMIANEDVVPITSWALRVPPDGSEASGASPTFQVPPGARSLTVDVTSDLDGDHALVYLSAIDLTTGEAHNLDLGGRVAGTGWVATPNPGPWTIRAEVARESTLAEVNKLATFQVTTGRVWKTPAWIAMGLGFATLLVGLAAYYAFERSRWENADV